MADTVERLHYAGETRPVEIKQSAWEGSAAHPERDGAKSEVGGSTEMLVDGHSGHGGASNGDGQGTKTFTMTRRIDLWHYED